MIIRANLDWLTISVVSLPVSYASIHDDISERFNLQQQDYLIKNCHVAYNELMNVHTHTKLEYMIIELKPLFFWRYLPDIISDEFYYIKYIQTLFASLGYSISNDLIRFNRVDIAIDYMGEFKTFDDTFNGIKRKKINSIESIRNVGMSETGRSTYLNGSSWCINRYEKSKEIATTEKSYYPDLYRDNNIIRLEIRLKKDYLKNYDKNRQKFFSLFKTLFEQIDDDEMNDKNIFNQIEKIKSIKNNVKGEYMILKEKIISDILNNLEQLNALENVYSNQESNLQNLLDEINSRYNPQQLKDKERHYRHYLKSS